MEAIKEDTIKEVKVDAEQKKQEAAKKKEEKRKKLISKKQKYVKEFKKYRDISTAFKDNDINYFIFSELLQDHLNKINGIKSDINSIHSGLNKKIGILNSMVMTLKKKKRSEIRVVEEDGTWGDYTGSFYATEDEQEEIVYTKAKKHYKRYFDKGTFYGKSTFGLFINDKNGKRLVEVLKDKGNKPIKTAKGE